MDELWELAKVVLPALLGGLVSAVAACLTVWAQRPKLLAEVRSMDAQSSKVAAETDALQAKLIADLIAQVAALQQQVAEIPALKEEIESLRRQLGTRKDELAELRARLDDCVQARAGGVA